MRAPRDFAAALGSPAPPAVDLGSARKLVRGALDRLEFAISNARIGADPSRELEFVAGMLGQAADLLNPPADQRRLP